jgi:hypothetical protein
MKVSAAIALKKDLLVWMCNMLGNPKNGYTLESLEKS